MNARSVIPDDINELLRLVRAGKLFAIQEWIKAGNALRVADSDERPSSVICAAAGTGFHSLVEELLRAGGWSSSELADALETARSSKHFEVAALLEHHGAHPKPLDFQTSCENLDLFMMERHLRTGTDPNSDNVFARMLSSVKADHSLVSTASSAPSSQPWAIRRRLRWPKRSKNVKSAGPLSSPGQAPIHSGASQTAFPNPFQSTPRTALPLRRKPFGVATRKS